jgi:hypothetical protein
LTYFSIEQPGSFLFVLFDLFLQWAARVLLICLIWLISPLSSQGPSYLSYLTYFSSEQPGSFLFVLFDLFLQWAARVLLIWLIMLNFTIHKPRPYLT